MKNRTTIYTSVIILVIFSFFLTGGCGDSGGTTVNPQPTNSDQSTSEISKTGGGSVVVGEGRVTFPANSVTSDVIVTGTIVEGRNLPAGVQLIGSVYSFTMSEPTAYVPDAAIISLPTEGYTLGVNIYHSADGINWDNIGGTVSVSKISATIPGFSYFAVGKTYVTPTPTQPEGSWEILNPLPAPIARYGHTMVEINGSVYLYGGLNDTINVSQAGELNDLWRFNPDNNDFTELSPSNPPQERYGHSAVVYNSSKYIVGGYGSGGEILNDIWKYDPQTNTWAEVIPFDVPSLQPDFAETPEPTATVLPENGGGWLMNIGAGGNIPEAVEVNMDYIGTINDTQTYEIEIDRDLTGGEIEVFLPNPFSGGQNKIVFEIFNEAGTKLGGETIVSTPSGDTETAKITDLLDYDGERKFVVYYQVPGVLPPRYNHISAQVGSKTFVTGGNNGNTDLKDSWIFDHTTNKWSSMSDFPGSSSLLNGASSGVYDNKVYIFGTTNNVIYTYDITTDTWAQINSSGNVPSPHVNSAYCQIGNKVYLLGGSFNNLPDTESSVFDMETGVWSSFDTLPEGREDGAASATGNSIVTQGGIDTSNISSDNVWFSPGN